MCHLSPFQRSNEHENQTSSTQKLYDLQALVVLLCLRLCLLRIFELYKLRLSLVLLFRISCLLTLILLLPPFLFVQKSHAWRSFAILSTVPHILRHLCDGEKTIRGFARNTPHLQNQMSLACASQPSNWRQLGDRTVEDNEDDSWVCEKQTTWGVCEGWWPDGKTKGLNAPISAVRLETYRISNGQERRLGMGEFLVLRVFLGLGCLWGRDNWLSVNPFTQA